MGATGALVAFAWWQGAQRFGTAGGRWGVAVVVAVVAVATAAFGARRQRQSSRAWLSAGARAVASARSADRLYAAGVLSWLLVFAAVFGWDLFSFLSQSHDLPTLSYLAGRVTQFRAGKAVLFAAWMAFGGYLAVGWRKDVSR